MVGLLDLDNKSFQTSTVPGKSFSLFSLRIVDQILVESKPFLSSLDIPYPDHINARFSLSQPLWPFIHELKMF
jgi:hypothetical protein